MEEAYISIKVLVETQDGLMGISGGEDGNVTAASSILSASLA